MVFELPRIELLDFCEGCIYGKYVKNYFLWKNLEKAYECLKLMHVDLCNPMKT